MLVARRLKGAHDGYLGTLPLRSRFSSSVAFRQSSVRPKWRLQQPHLAQTCVRSAKTVSKRKVRDLEQGVISAEPLLPQDNDDVPQYPSVLQGAKNNMIKFDKCVLLTRVGNFYELYFEHAEEYGPLLGLKVSSKKTTVGPVSMAGFPIWQIDRFLKILVQDLNKYVAVSEEFPVTISGKVKSGGIMYDRRVTRVVTPGTLIDEKFLDPYQNNFLLSIHIDQPETPESGGQDSSNTASEHDVGLAWLDLSTGDFFTQTTNIALLSSVVMRIGAREILVAQDLPQTLSEEIRLLIGHTHDLVTSHKPQDAFHSMSEWNVMLESPVASTADHDFTIQEKIAGHQLLDYVRVRLQGIQLQLQPPRRREMQSILTIDRSSLRGLEILETARDGFGKGSLFHAVRRTVTKSGARLLRDRLTTPSASLNEINGRLDLVTRFKESDELREAIVHHLRKTYDVQRLVQKFTLNKGDADDMLCLAKAISETSYACQVLADDIDKVSVASTGSDTFSSSEDPIKAVLARFSHDGPLGLSQSILDAIDEEGLDQKHRLEENEAADIAALAHEVVMQSAPEELDSLPRAIRSKSKSDSRDLDTEIEEPWIMRVDASETLSRLHQKLSDLKAEKIELANRLREELSAPSLTLKWTPGLGHICHIKSANGFDRNALESMNARMVSSSKSTRSFYLTDWSRLGSRMEQARHSIRGEEQRIFNDLRQLVVKNLVHLRRNAAIMDELDIATSFATLADEQAWVRPRLNDGFVHKIIGGRHPTVKLGLEEHGRSFVSNDLILGENERAWIVTGPNMAGKSTFLRQNALITILAQIGSFVPAEHAEIGLVDQIFSRIGAADDLFRDQSTFMVEMLETAAILKNATPRSFVIMDEVGRGTTPEDGTAVAYASLHHLYHTNRCRTLFATHFHSLVDMTEEWDCVGRYCTDILEDASGSFSFVHKLRPGVNRQSHALRVAKMAGLPASALNIATQVLNNHRLNGLNISAPLSTSTDKTQLQASAMG